MLLGKNVGPNGKDRPLGYGAIYVPIGGGSCFSGWFFLPTNAATASAFSSFAKTMNVFLMSFPPNAPWFN